MSYFIDPRVLAVKVGPGAVLAMRLLDADIDIWNPGYPDTVVINPHQHDRDPNLDVVTHITVGLITFGYEVTGEAF